MPKALAGASFASGEQDTGLGGNDDFDREAGYPGIDRFVLALGQRAMGRAKGISARPADQTNITSQAPMHVRAYDGRTSAHDCIDGVDLAVIGGHTPEPELRCAAQARQP